MTSADTVPLIIDTLAEVYDLLRPWAADEFWDISQHEVTHPAIYVFGRQQMVENRPKIREMCAHEDLVVVFGNSAEGSTTLIDQCDRVLGLKDLIQSRKLLLISGGDLPAAWPHMTHEHFLTRVLDYEENLSAQALSHEIFDIKHKPYKFLFLNGRARPHRRYLLQQLAQKDLLSQSLWTMLDGRRCPMIDFAGHGDNMSIKHLPAQYEVPRYQSFQISNDYPHQFIKHDMFGGEWGEIYLHLPPYRDTYFSLITETVYQTDYSFRTEKIAKCLAIGHPWICAANKGFYRDLKNLGFQTFDGLIDETFDSTDNDQARMDRIVSVVQDLCSSDLVAFLSAANPICKYNQQFLKELVTNHRSRFADRFFSFIKKSQLQ